jgi:hypothetical protein
MRPKLVNPSLNMDRRLALLASRFSRGNGSTLTTSRRANSSEVMNRQRRFPPALRHLKVTPSKGIGGPMAALARATIWRSSPT